MFGDYLSQETAYEVLMTSRGYVVIAWEGKSSSFTGEYCGTPEALRDELLGCYENLLEYEITYGERDITEAEISSIQEKTAILRDRCNTE